MLKNNMLNEENYVEVINSFSLEDWTPLFDLIPKIEATTDFGQWEEIKGNGTLESPYSFPHVIYSEIVDEFCRITNRMPIMIIFPWMQWDELDNYVKNNEFDFDSIDIPTKCKVISATIRAERFCEGAILSKFKSGQILRILKSIKFQIESK